MLFAGMLLFYFIVFLPTDRYYDKIVTEAESSSVSDIITKLDAGGGWIHIYTSDGNELLFSPPTGGYTSKDFNKKVHVGDSIIKLSAERAIYTKSKDTDSLQVWPFM